MIALATFTRIILRPESMVTNRNCTLETLLETSERLENSHRKTQYAQLSPG
jgi:hypothetical protein